MPSPTLAATLDQHRADLSAALLKLEQAGLDDTPAAHMCRRYRAKVKWALREARFDKFNSLAGIVGENGWAPGIRDALLDAEFELNRLVPVIELSRGSIFVGERAGICKGAVA